MAGIPLIKLRLLNEELGNALNLAGNRNVSTSENYQLFKGSFVHKTADAYIFLLFNNKDLASKVLIRSIFEAAIRMYCVNSQPEIMHRIAYTEFRDERRQIENMDGCDKNVIKKLDDQWNEGKSLLQKEFPNWRLVDKEIKVQELYSSVKMLKNYNTQYRLYCKYTHASLRASAGMLEALYVHDNHSVALALIIALTVMSNLGINYSRLQNVLTEAGSLFTTD